LTIFDEWYQNGATNKIIVQQIQNMGYGGERIICDCADKKISPNCEKRESVRNSLEIHVAGMTKSLSQTVDPASWDSYTILAQIASENLKKLRSCTNRLKSF